jgi:hypothetical protein
MQQSCIVHTYGYQYQPLSAYVAGDCKSLQKKISAELRGLAFMHGVAWMAAMAVMRHTSDGR